MAVLSLSRLSSSYHTSPSSSNGIDIHSPDLSLPQLTHVLQSLDYTKPPGSPQQYSVVRLVRLDRPFLSSGIATGSVGNFFYIVCGSSRKFCKITRRKRMIHSGRTRLEVSHTGFTLDFDVVIRHKHKSTGSYVQCCHC